MKVKLLYRIRSLGEKGAIVEVPDEQAKDMVRREVCIFYTKEQADADQKAEEAALALIKAQEQEAAAKAAADAEAAKESAAVARQSARVPDQKKK